MKCHWCQACVVALFIHLTQQRKPDTFSPFLTTAIPKKCNSLAPSVQSASLFLMLYTSYACITDETEQTSHNKAMYIALCLSFADHGIRKVSKNTYSLFSAVAHGVSVAGSKAKKVIQSCYQNNAIGVRLALLRYSYI